MKCDICLKKKPKKDMRLVQVLRFDLKTRGKTQDYETEKSLTVCIGCVAEMNFAPLKEVVG